MSRVVKAEEKIRMPKLKGIKTNISLSKKFVFTLLLPKIDVIVNIYASHNLSLSESYGIANNMALGLQIK